MSKNQDQNLETNDKTLERLIHAVNLVYTSPWRLFWRGLLWGLAQGLGATLGLAIVLGIFFYVLRSAGLFEYFQNLLENLRDIGRSLPGN